MASVTPLGRSDPYNPFRNYAYAHDYLVVPDTEGPPFTLPPSFIDAK